MKKIFIASSVVLAVLAVAFAGFVGFASAQTPNPDSTLCPSGVCDGQAQGMGGGRMMGGRWSTESFQGMGGGMMGRRGGQQGAIQGEGLLSPYMVSAFAETFGMTPEALQAELDGGKRMFDIALANGYTAEQFPELMTTVRTAALADAVAAGTITQEQADWMLERGQNRQAGGLGTGSCRMQTTP